MAITSKEVSFLKTCINGINALSGVGILSVPYALSTGGWLSLIILLIIAASAYFTGLLIRRCMDSNPLITTYTDIVGTAFGKRGKLAASVFVCLELYLVATGFLILEGDNFHKLAPNFKLKLGSLILSGRHSFIIIAGAMISPSVWLSDLGLLSYISFGGVLSSLIITVCVFWVGMTKGVGFDEKGSLLNFKGLPNALSLYTFCYGAHAIFPTLYTSMRKKNLFPKVLLISFVVCTATYMAMAIIGYLIYGQYVQSQITLSLPKGKISSKIAIYTILAVPIAKYSFCIMPISAAIQNCFPENYQDNRAITIGLRMLVLISTVFLAILFPSFESVVSLSGAILIVIVSFLLPCACYMKIFGVYRKLGYELASIGAVMLLAVAVGVLGTYASVVQIVKQS